MGGTEGRGGVWCALLKNVLNGRGWREGKEGGGKWVEDAMRSAGVQAGESAIVEPQQYGWKSGVLSIVAAEGSRCGRE